LELGGFDFWDFGFVSSLSSGSNGRADAEWESVSSSESIDSRYGASIVFKIVLTARASSERKAGANARIIRMVLEVVPQ
jgi:hypothetical protein